MLDKSTREELIEELKSDNSLLAEIPDGIVDDSNIVEKENYILFLRHLLFLNKKKNTSDEKERKQLLRRIFIVQEYMLEAQYGDYNLKRFQYDTPKPVHRST